MAGLLTRAAGPLCVALVGRSTHQGSGFLFPSNPVQPFTYSSGTGGVIKGWDDGVGTMKLGERAKISIPWQYAYGAAAHPRFKIPGQ